MLSSSKIIRGQAVEGEKTYPLEIRHKFHREETETGISREELIEEMLNEAQNKLLKAEAESRAIFDSATAEAADIIRNAMEDARREAEEIKREARESGFQEGRKEALAKATAEANDIKDQARSVLRQSEEIRRRTLDSLEDEIIDLAKDMAGKILFAELRQNPEIILAVAGEAVEMLKNRDEVVLYVNPSETAIIEKRVDELKNLIPPKAALHIISDAGVSPGGIVAETRHGRVDANIGTRWQALMQALKGEEP
ncbi:flagellar assembly protein FliH [Desulfocucumis palustris]|uniref:Flagellar assembly protein FliH n=1 Tax=Desulfocucumis palustris TaxID=1898651 RepID=A0A2L2XAR7_9FIRM|nr:FliH/SctL family protein [Desulfocucumis palustris]GBF33190.1 flagellar assembly protein FliH [Desulfocucumis palustris]